MTTFAPQAGPPRPPVQYPVTIAFPIHWGGYDTSEKVRVPDDVRQAIVRLGGPPAGQAP